MEILVVTDKSGANAGSIVNHPNKLAILGELPAGLKTGLQMTLGHLREAKRILCFPDEKRKLTMKRIVVDMVTKNTSLEELHGLGQEAKERILEILELLHWFLSPRFRPGTGPVGSSQRYCADCGARFHEKQTECMELACLSIAKMRLATGE